MNITDEENTVIHTTFPDLVNLLYEWESERYNVSFVSIFDHWLEREECYRIFEDNPDEIRNRQNKFMKLICSLYQSTPIYTARFRRNRKDKLSIKRIKSAEVLAKKCKFHLLDEDYGQVFRFIIPEFSIVYTQGNDWTHSVNYSDDKKVKRFKEYIESFDLYWLNQSNKV
jgi:hypothetical protein